MSFTAKEKPCSDDNGFLNCVIADSAEFPSQSPDITMSRSFALTSLIRSRRACSLWGQASYGDRGRECLRPTIEKNGDISTSTQPTHLPSFSLFHGFFLCHRNHHGAQKLTREASQSTRRGICLTSSSFSDSLFCDTSTTSDPGCHRLKRADGHGVSQHGRPINDR